LVGRRASTVRDVIKRYLDLAALDRLDLDARWDLPGLSCLG
jgi:hypothetical protein